MSRNNTIYLYGSGGHANVVTEVANANGVEVQGVYDDAILVHAETLKGIKLSGGNFQVPSSPMIVSIGDNTARAEIVGMLDINSEFETLIHPTAIVSAASTIKEGSVVLHGAIVQANATIGRHALINTGASVDHDVVLGDFVHISPKAVLCGHVVVGDGTHVGAGAVVIPSVKIGEWCTIGAGAVVISNVPDYCTVVGNPAKIIKQYRPDLARPESKIDFDLCVLGAGLSATMALKNLVKEFEACSENGVLLTSPLQVAIIEKAKDFFGGVAYGDRTGKNSLLISSLKEFLPPCEIEDFKSWLSANKSWIFDDLQMDSGAMTTEWMARSWDFVTQDQWDDLYLPRYIYGMYLRKVAEACMKKAATKGWIECRCINAEVEDLEKVDGRFVVKIRDANSQQITLKSQKVVLALGSPPKKKLLEERAYSGNLGGLLINAPYQHGMRKSLKSVAAHITKHKFKDVSLLLLGTNASTIEAVYNLLDFAPVYSCLNKIYAISPSGRFPGRLGPETESETEVTHVLTEHLDVLDIHKDVTAKQVYEAAVADILNARELGVTFRQSSSVIMRAACALLKTLDLSEQQAFVDQYGNRLGRYQRRAGDEYRNVVDKLIGNGQLEVVKGEFKQIATSTNRGITFDYIDEDGDLKRFGDRVQVVMNCTGFEKVNLKSSSLLTRRLIEKGLCEPNNSQIGFRVNERLEASPGLFVLGPLLAGNVIGDDLVWHMEQCGRIVKYSGILSKTLVELFCDSQASVKT